MGHRVDLLFPEQRLVFEVGAGTAELQQTADSPSGFARYKEIQRAGEAAAMLVVPNSCLIQASRKYVVDPGVAMQGAPYSSAVGNLGVDPFAVKDVILTHLHFDHVGALMEFPGRRCFVHRIELEAPYAFIQKSLLETVEVIELDGEEGEIEPGLRWILTPGHSDGLITLLVDTDDGLVGDPERLRRSDARVLRSHGAAGGLPRSRDAAQAVAADPRPRPGEDHPWPLRAVRAAAGRGLNCSYC